MPGKTQFAQLILLFFLIVSTDISAQYALAKFDLEGDIRQWYDDNLGLDKSGILNGEYGDIQRQSRDSHQFFGRDQWLVNTITYRGERYDSIYLRYDIERDLVLIRHPTSYRYHAQPIKLIQDEIETFEVDGHQFRRYNHDILSYPPGFFDELYLGNKINLLCKRIKITETNQTLIYVSEDKLILEREGEYYRVKNKGSILRLFKPYKQEIKTFIQEQNLNINRENEYDFIALVRFCDHLITINGL